MNVTIRRFQPADAATVCEIFYRSVHEVAISRYSAAQIDAWAPKIPDAERWLQRLREYDTFVADDETGKSVGWIAMTSAGYIDMLFCLPEATGRGVAAKLYAAVEQAAALRGLTQLTAHASLLAQSFFERNDWTVQYLETVVRNGVAIPRASMAKNLR
jgi:putative acetyltransferase